MQGHIIGAPVMLSLGGYPFGTSTAAYQELSRSTEYRWPSQDRFNQSPALQFTGEGSDTITLPGVIYPEWRGGIGQIDSMRGLAAGGEPLLMIDGLGRVLGMWVIERIEERGSVFAAFGIARKQEFTINLRKFGESDSLLESAIDLSGFQLVQVAASVAMGAVGTIKQIANGGFGSATQVIGSLTTALGTITGMSPQIGVPYQGIVNSIGRSISAAVGMQNASSDALGIIAKVPTTNSALSGASGIMDACTRQSRVATGASASLKTSTDLMTTDAARAAVTLAQVAANKVTVLTASLRDSASDMIDRFS